MWVAAGVVKAIRAAGSVQGPPQHTSDKDTRLASDGSYEAPSPSAALVLCMAPGLLSRFSQSLGFQIISDAKRVVDLGHPLCCSKTRGGMVPAPGLGDGVPRPAPPRLALAQRLIPPLSTSSKGRERPVSDRTRANGFKLKEG